MTEVGWVLAGFGAAIIVILLSLVAFALVSTLFEVRATARTIRELVERIAPHAEMTIENVRDVTDAAVRGTTAFRKFTEGLPSLRPSGGGGSMWAMLGAAAMALFSAYRKRRARRRGE